MLLIDLVVARRFGRRRAYDEAYWARHWHGADAEDWLRKTIMAKDITPSHRATLRIALYLLKRRPELQLSS